MTYLLTKSLISLHLGVPFKVMMLCLVVDANYGIVLLRIVRCILWIVMAVGCLLGVLARRVVDCCMFFGNVDRKGA